MGMTDERGEPRLAVIGFLDHGLKRARRARNA
jgi:hypothetical protein